MSSDDEISVSEGQPEAAPLFPLLDDDPVKVGDFWLDARVASTPAGTAFVAHEDGGDATLLMLLSAGAAADPAARSRFSGEINAMHIDTVVARGGQDQDEGLMQVRFRGETDDPTLDGHAPLAPWVALAFDGSAAAAHEAERVLQAIDLSTAPPLGPPSGPDYRLHWIDDTAHGPTRIWPLAWPGRGDRASWITILVSFLLMALVAALALLLAILVFQNQPLVNAPQPIPSAGGGSGSGSPQSGGSGSGSPQPASPSPGESGQGGSPEPSGSGDAGGSPGGDNGGPYSHSPSMNIPSGNQSGPSDPSPNPKL
ncbi:hypothetical protein [Tessaracoccus sp.]|uniref:hypothetical protein n=1 Tax=Tessaracoccus sp. TaxID=1971211 RepID=UPI0026243387|nr:hypothetical protein [Tessaracoccus sp.]